MTRVLLASIIFFVQVLLAFHFSKYFLPGPSFKRRFGPFANHKNLDNELKYYFFLKSSIFFSTLS